MNEAETRAEYIDPKLKESGWGVAEGSKILREYPITAGKIQTGGTFGTGILFTFLFVHSYYFVCAVGLRHFDSGRGVKCRSRSIFSPNGP